MKYFKKIDLDWLPFQNRVIKLIEACPHLVEEEQGAFVLLNKEQKEQIMPELLQMIKPLGLTIQYVGLYTIHEKTGTLHIDRTTVPVRITLPIINCQDTVTTFYQVAGQGIEGTQQNGLGATYYDPEKSKPVASYELTGPVVLRVLEPHQVVINHDRLPRTCCSIAFVESIEHLLE
jgi:hypothetical protein